MLSRAIWALFLKWDTKNNNPKLIKGGGGLCSSPPPPPPSLPQNGHQFFIYGKIYNVEMLDSFMSNGGPEMKTPPFFMGGGGGGRCHNFAPWIHPRPPPPGFLGTNTPLDIRITSVKLVWFKHARKPEDWKRVLFDQFALLTDISKSSKFEGL